MSSNTGLEALAFLAVSDRAASAEQPGRLFDEILLNPFVLAGSERIPEFIDNRPV